MEVYKGSEEPHFSGIFYYNFHSDFDKLTYLEKSACMVNRLYQNVYKATPETGGEGHFNLSGHMIVFEHTGMKEASKFVVQLPRSDMKEQVKVIYLGTKDKKKGYYYSSSKCCLGTWHIC